MTALERSHSDIGACTALRNVCREEQQMRDQLLGRVLSKEAYYRLGTVQSVDPKRARLIEDRVIDMARTGQLLQEVRETSQSNCVMSRFPGRLPSE
jgi:DNA-binding TFAR19-related protein (PDSD5 family)